MMSKKIKKLIVAVCSLALVACMSVSITLAYLTAQTGTVENSFTVGNVSFDVNGALDEAKVTEYGVKDGETRVTANAYKLIPGHTYTKDPTVHMSATTENAWLFVKVENGIAAIEAQGDTTIAKQMETLGWEEIDADNGIYAYPTEVTKDQDIVVFNSFTLASDAVVDTYVNAKITIQAYAVQADGLASAAAAWAAAPLTAWTGATGA